MDSDHAGHVGKRGTVASPPIRGAPPHRGRVKRAPDAFSHVERRKNLITQRYSLSRRACASSEASASALLSRSETPKKTGKVQDWVLSVLC
jgi:hypothetical protein